MLASSSGFASMHILWLSLLLLPWGISVAFGPVQPLDFKMTFNKDILAVGDTLRLNCSLTTNESAALEVHHNRRSLTEFVTYSDGHRVEIVIQNVSLEHHGMYHCYKNKDQRPSTISVHVAYPPKKPRNIVCISDDLENMTCTWDPVKTSEQLNIKTNWTLYYKIGIEKNLDTGGSLMHDYACHNPQKAMACNWFKHEQHSGGDYFRPGYFYLIWVTASNVLGSATSDPQLVDTKAIVKLRPVTEVSVTAISKSSVCVNWTMTFPSSAPLKLIYNITLTCTECLNAHLWQTGPINHGKHFRRVSNPLLEVVLKDLEPYTEYTVSVRVKTKSGGYWSDPSEPVTTTTLEGVPRGSPSLTNASFTEFHSSTKGRQLSVYWQPLERKYQGGVITEYLVNVTPPTSGSKGKSLGQHRLAGSKPMVAALTLEDGKKYEIRVAAATQHGYGPYSQPLIIPPESQVMPSVTMVTAEANSSHGIVSWSKPEGDVEATKYLIHYCQGHITQLGTHIAQCTDSYSWFVVSGNQTSATVVLPEHQDVSKYVIGVSMETELGSGGIVWSPCMFKSQGIPGKLQKTKVGEREFTSVTLTWFPLSCMSAQVKVRSYEVSVCEDVEVRCTCGQGRIIEHRGVWDLHTARVERLRPGQAYSLCVRGLGADGPGAWSNPIKVSTDRPAPWGVILGCSLAGIFLVIMIVMWLGIHRYLMTPVVVSFDIPKAVNMDVYDQSGTKEEEENGSRGDNFYTLVQGEQEPLMAVQGTVERPSKLQHVPVSHDSGNDSLSEESGQPVLEDDQLTTPLTTPRTTPSVIRAKVTTLPSLDNIFQDGEKEELKTMATHSSPPRLSQKRESGFFDDVGAEQPGGQWQSKKKKPLAAVPTVEVRVGAVGREEADSSESITPYSRFEEEGMESGPQSGSSPNSYVVYHDINNAPKPGLKQPLLKGSKKTKPAFCPKKLKHPVKKTENEALLDNINNNNNNMDSDGKDVQVEVDEMEFGTESNQEEPLETCTLEDGDEPGWNPDCTKTGHGTKCLAPLPKSNLHRKQPVIVPYVQISDQGHIEGHASQPAASIPEYMSASPESGGLGPGVCSQGAEETPLKVAQPGGYVSHQQIPSLANSPGDNGSVFKHNQSVC